MKCMLEIQMTFGWYGMVGKHAKEVAPPTKEVLLLGYRGYIWNATNDIMVTYMEEVPSVSNTEWEVKL